MSYNLDENAAESFDFEVGGHKYKMRYPTTEEILDAQQKIKDDPAKQLEWIYSYVESASPETPPIKETLQKVNTRVMRNFNKMLKEEFGEEALS